MKRDNFEKDLLDTGSLMKDGYTYLINNAGKAIAVITLVVASLATFTNIAFLDLGGTAFSATLIMLLIASYLMYFSLEDAGERLGEDTEEYKSALERYKAARDGIKPDHIYALREYCEQYSRDELDYRRRAKLCEIGYSTQEYEAYISGKKLDTRAMRALRRIKNMRCVRLTPTTLLSSAKHSSVCEPRNPEPMKFISMIVKLIPTTICTFFTASVILTTKDNLTASVVIDGLMKLSTLPIVGFRGYTAGYSYVKNQKAAWIEGKARILESFLATAHDFA